jgi:8-oxo-dGTP pyrophosphatase MutT (NUDIX family)
VFGDEGPRVSAVLDPLSQPIDQAFALDPGPAVPCERLLAAALRRRIAQPPAWSPEQVFDGILFRPGRAPRPAAVLIALVPREEGLRVLFTRRSHDLPEHPGQISLPGGRVEAGDGGPVPAALREATEEVGLAAAAVEVLGTLPLYRTVTGYEVTPVIGLLQEAPRLRADPVEVSEIFEVPLAHLMDGARYQRRIVGEGGDRRHFYAIEYVERATERSYFIWGATAAILRNFYRLLIA